MGRFDHLALDPTPRRVARWLADARRMAEADLPRSLRWTSSPAEAAQEYGDTPAGVRTVSGQGWYQTRAEVRVAWWTDPSGRKHARVTGRPVVRSDPADPAAPHPLAVLYPGVLVSRRVGKPPAPVAYPDSPAYYPTAAGFGPTEWFAVCGCGAVGSPEALGWMGEACGPCFDRQQEGGATPPPATLPGWSEGRFAVAFSPDGLRVAGVGAKDRLRVVERATGRRWEAPVPAWLAAEGPVAFAAGGRVVLFAAAIGYLAAWDPDTGGTGVSRLPAGALPLFTPDGSRLIGCGGFRGWAVQPDDLSDPLRVLWDRGAGDFVGAVTPDGRSVLRLTRSDRIVSVDAATGAEMECPGPGFPPDARPDRLWLTAVAPDGDTAAVTDQVVYAGHRPAVWVGSVTRGGWRLLQNPWPARETTHWPGAWFTPDGRWAVTTAADGSVGFWPVPLPAEHPGPGIWLRGSAVEEPGGPTELTFGPDGETLAVATPADGGGVVQLWPWRHLLPPPGGSG